MLSVMRQRKPAQFVKRVIIERGRRQQGRICDGPGNMLAVFVHHETQRAQIANRGIADRGKRQAARLARLAQQLPAAHQALYRMAHPCAIAVEPGRDLAVTWADPGGCEIVAHEAEHEIAEVRHGGGRSRRRGVDLSGTGHAPPHSPLMGNVR